MRCSKKALILAYVFPPIAYAGTYRTLRFCRYLPQYGWTPCVVTIKEGADLDNDYGLLSRIPKEAKVYRTKTVDFWRIRRKWAAKRGASRNKNAAPNAARNSKPAEQGKVIAKAKSLIWELLTIPDHMVFWIPFAVLKGIDILRKEKCDIIYSTSPPHSEHAAAFILSRLFRKPWIADFRDPILDSSGYAPSSKLRHVVDKALEKLVVENASTILIISKQYQKIMQERYPHLSHKFVTMPNGFDPDTFENSQAEHFDKFTILYSGSFYANRQPDFFLKGLKKWLLSKPALQGNIQVLFHGLDSEELGRKVTALELDSVVQAKGLIPQDALVRKQKGADLLLLIIGFDPESRGTVTSKVFEYIACNRPILAIIPEGDASEILKGYDMLYWVHKENEELLVTCLDQAYEHYTNNYHHLGQSVDNFSPLDSPYNARIQTKRLANLFSDAILA